MKSHYLLISSRNASIARLPFGLGALVEVGEGLNRGVSAQNLLFGYAYSSPSYQTPAEVEKSPPI